MKIKICGMKYMENIHEIAALQPDFMGFIYYPKSKRYVGENFSESAVMNIPKNVKKVGVFVNDSFENILAKCKAYELDFVQLHGKETSQLCQLLMEINKPVIKAFQINDTFDFAELITYQPYCNYFLFDTKSENDGGSGKSFNWKILERYKLDTPFFLSGGLGIENIEEALQIAHPMLYGVDLNSKLESEPALKLKEVSKVIVQKIRNHEHI